MNFRDLPDMSDAIRQVYEKKLDPVGTADADIDNDGDHDSSDKYLLKRRKAIAGAMGKKTHICAKLINYRGEQFETIPEQHTMLEDGTVTHYDITNGEVIYENVPVEELEVVLAEAHEHFDNYDKNAEVLGEKFDIVEWAEEVIAGLSESEEIDELDDEELIGLFEEALLELSEDSDEIWDMATILELMESEMECISEEIDTEAKREIGGIKRKISHSKKMSRMVSRSSQLSALKAKKANNSERDAGAEARETLNKPADEKKATRGERLKAAAKGAASAVKKVAVKTAGAAGEVAGAVRGGYEKGRTEAGGSPRPAARPAARPVARSSGRTDTSRGATRRAARGALGAVGNLIKTGVKKAVGKTARAVSRGSNALARRLGEDYEQIAHLYESGLFSISEIENVIEEGYKEIDRAKENKMYRRAGNLARTALSSKGKEKEDAMNKSGKIVSAITKQKENERFDRIGKDPKHQNNYKEEVDLDEGLKGALKGGALGAAIGTVVPVVGTGLGAAVGATQGLLRNDRKDKFVKNAKKRAKNEYKNKFEEVDPEVELFVDLLVDEGADLSEFTWEDMHEEYEMMDEGLRSAVKKLLGKKEAPAEKKPESRGEYLRKKYNVGPEKSDTSAKRQILDRTRAKAERDEKEYGGSHYSKSVAKKSKDAHDRYLKAGYSKYGADDRRGSGNKARKRAAALTKEEMVMESIVKRAVEKAKSEYGKYKKFGKASPKAVDRLQSMNAHKQDKYGPSTFKQRLKTGAEHNIDNEKKAKEGK